jgi:hypothetical protein
MKWARWAGVLLQALVLGALLFLAVARLVAIQTDSRIFQYQDF